MAIDGKHLSFTGAFIHTMFFVLAILFVIKLYAWNNTFKLKFKLKTQDCNQLKSFQTILTNFYQITHSKRFLQIITSWELIPNKSCKQLSENSFKTIFKNYYQQRTHYKQILKTVRAIILNNSYNLLPEISVQTILTNY